MDSLRRAKASHRADILHLNKTLNEVEALKPPVKDAAKVDALKEKLLSSKRKLEDVGTTVLSLLDDEDDIEAEVLENEELSDKIISAVSCLDALLGESKSSPSEANSCTQFSSLEGLPRITRPTFDGDYLQFRPFMDQFTATVHDRDISDVHKFTYLQSALRGPAREAIRGISCTAENYKSAMTILTERFGDPSLLISLYSDKLMHLPSLKTNSVVAFRDLLTSFESCLREIIQLTKDLLYSSGSSDPATSAASLHGLLLAPLLTGKLPRASQLEWARRARSPKEKFDLDSLLSFAKSEVEALEALSTTESSATASSAKVRNAPPAPRPTAAVSSLRIAPILCKFCESDHHSPFKCKFFMNMNVERRNELVRQHSLCFNCLGNHHLKECRSSLRCRQCDRQHHTLLHRDYSVARPQPVCSASADSAPITSTSVNCVSPDYNPQRLSILQTARVRVKGVKRPVRILLDSGSEESYVTQALVRDSAPQFIDQRPRQFETFGGSRSDPVDCPTYQLHLSSLYCDHWVGAKLITVPVICSPTRTLPRSQFQELCKRFPGLPFADEESENLDIDILLGMDAIPQIILHEDRVFRYQRLTLTSTIFGYVIGGSIASTAPNVSLASVAKSLRASSCLDQISRLWEIDCIGIEPPAKKAPLPKPHHNGERYEMSLPWLDDRRPSMSSNQANLRNNSFRRLSSDVQEQYCRVFEEYHSLKILEPTDKEKGNFIPHHAVMQGKKLRVVYDASAKPWKGPSLNNCLDPGPNLLQQLVFILLQFRAFEYPLVADVEKAFLMVGVTPEDRDFLKIVWIDALGNHRYSRFTRVPFGLNCGPFLLLTTIRTHLDNLPLEEKSLIKKISDGMYMDDLVTGATSATQLLTLREDCQRIFLEAGMNLREFHSTPSVMSNWTSATPVSRKVLGLTWSPTADSISVSLTLLPASTRRQVASSVAQLFDPLGLVSPWTIRLRIFLQSLWKSCHDWDASLTPEDQELFDSLVEASAGESVCIPRHVVSNESSQLHVFADASPKAYAAVVYLRTNDDTFLLCSRARVAPLKPQMSIPRLELMAALLAIRLLQFVKDVSSIFSTLPAFLYSDSMLVLGWIRKAPSDIFVRNRVKEILCSTSANDWHHIPGDQNPADVPSRGLCASLLPSCDIWFHGPFPLDINASMSSSLIVSSDPPPSVTSNILPQPSMVCIFPLERYGSLRKAARVAAWVKRFIRNLSSRRKIYNDLSLEEEDEGNLLLLRDCQRVCGLKEYAALKGGEDVPCKSPIYDGRPEMDPVRGIIVCNPRNGELPLPWLPIPSDLAQLVTLECHHRLYHMGVSSTTYEVRLSYWTRRCRQFVKKVISKCARCKRMQSRRLESPEGELPAFRVEAARPFDKAGLDHFGPLYMRDKVKMWVLLFTCSVTRAVHLEAVSSLDVAQTALAVRRFFARRGHSSLFLSDNGRSFTALSRILRGTLKWNVIPPASPWWGGFWERLIGTIKRSCLKTLGNVSLTHSEFVTTLAELEDIVNRRPLTASLSDDDDCLTPSHFLHGE